MHIVTIDLNVLGTFMDTRIRYNIESNLIITMQPHRLSMEDSQRGKKGLEACKLISSDSHDTILSFSGRPDNSLLLLSFLGYWGSAKLDKMLNHRTTS